MIDALSIATAGLITPPARTLVGTVVVQNKIVSAVAMQPQIVSVVAIQPKVISTVKAVITVPQVAVTALPSA